MGGPEPRINRSERTHDIIIIISDRRWEETQTQSETVSTGQCDHDGETGVLDCFSVVTVRGGKMHSGVLVTVVAVLAAAALMQQAAAKPYR